MIKTSIETNFSFRNLSKNLDKILGEYIETQTKGFAKYARNRIIQGKLRPLRKTTLKARRSGAGGRPRTNSTTPLFHTGKLFGSIKPIKGSSPTKSSGVELLEYGWFHHKGFDHHSAGKIAPRPFLFTASENLPPALKKEYIKKERELYKRLNRALRV